MTSTRLLTAENLNPPRPTLSECVIEPNGSVSPQRPKPLTKIYEMVPPAIIILDLSEDSRVVLAGMDDVIMTIL